MGDVEIPLHLLSLNDTAVAVVVVVDDDLIDDLIDVVEAVLFLLYSFLIRRQWQR